MHIHVPLFLGCPFAEALETLEFSLIRYIGYISSIIRYHQHTTEIESDVIVHVRAMHSDSTRRRLGAGVNLTNSQPSLSVAPT